MHYPVISLCCVKLQQNGKCQSVCGMSLVTGSSDRKSLAHIMQMMVVRSALPSDVKQLSSMRLSVISLDRIELHLGAGGGVGWLLCMWDSHEGTVRLKADSAVITTVLHGHSNDTRAFFRQTITIWCTVSKRVILAKKYSRFRHSVYWLCSKSMPMWELYLTSQELCLYFIHCF